MSDTQETSGGSSAAPSPQRSEPSPLIEIPGRWTESVLAIAPSSAARPVLSGSSAPSQEYGKLGCEADRNRADFARAGVGLAAGDAGGRKDCQWEPARPVSSASGRQSVEPEPGLRPPPPQGLPSRFFFVPPASFLPLSLPAFPPIHYLFHNHLQIVTRWAHSGAQSQTTQTRPLSAWS